MVNVKDPGLLKNFNANNEENSENDEEESEIIKQMSKSRGGKVKRYKKEKSLGVLC